MTVASIETRLATAEDAKRLASTLAAAFENDPILSWLIPDADDRRCRLTTFFDVEVRHVVLPVGRVWTSDPAVAASLELPPGQWRMPIRQQLLHGVSYGRVFRRRLGHAIALITLMERRHPRTDHYYLPYIGVTEAARGRGVGTALIRKTLARCDAAGLPAYLEATSERNAALYRRLGFEHLPTISIGGAPPVLPMLRAPRLSRRS